MGLKPEFPRWRWVAALLLLAVSGPGGAAWSGNADCQGPYHAVSADGRCLWSCGEGTEPDQDGGECVCREGLTEAGKDELERRVCRPEKDLPDLVITQAAVTQTETCEKRQPVLIVSAVIANVGSGDSLPARDHALVQATDQHGAWGNGKLVTTPIPAGGSITVSFPIYYLLSDPAHMLHASPHAFVVFADPGSVVIESDEGNNSFGPLSVTVAAPCGETARTAKRVFVSSAEFDGNFGAGQITPGHLAADQRCQDLAQAAGLSGNFKAWISGRQDVPEQGVADRFGHTGGPYRLVDGTTIAADWADLTDGTLRHSINKTEAGDPVAAGTRVWTNTRADGTAWDYLHDCAPRSSATWSCGAPSFTTGGCGLESGKFGIAGATGSEWSGDESSNAACTNRYRLYCFEQ